MTAAPYLAGEARKPWPPDDCSALRRSSLSVAAWVGVPSDCSLNCWMAPASCATLLLTPLPGTSSLAAAGAAGVPAKLDRACARPLTLPTSKLGGDVRGPAEA